MKLAKIFLTSFVLLAITSAFTYTKLTQQVDISESAGYLDWNGASHTPAIDFVISGGSATSATELNVRNNYVDNIASSASFSGTGKLATVHFTTSGSYNLGETATVQELIQAVKDNFDTINRTWPSSFNVTLHGKTFTIDIVQKS